MFHQVSGWWFIVGYQMPIDTGQPILTEDDLTILTEDDNPLLTEN